MQNHRLGRIVWVVAIVAISALSAGCRSNRPSDTFPAYYRSWDQTPATMTTRLDEARLAVIDGPEDGTAITAYALEAAELADWYAQRWLDFAGRHRDPQGPWATQVAGHRDRVVRSSREALALFRQAELLSHPIGWRGHVAVAWLLLLEGEEREPEASARLALALGDPAVPETARHEISALLNALTGKAPSSAETDHEEANRPDSRPTESKPFPAPAPPPEPPAAERCEPVEEATP